MRVLGGKLKGRAIICPKYPDLRPMSSLMKEATFSILGNYIDFHETQVLDLYCGSGSLGIEALSRGAQFCNFVEFDKKKIKDLKNNLHNFGLSSFAKLHNKKVHRFLANFESKVDLVFIDPPFSYHPGIRLADLVRPVLKDGSLLVLEGRYREDCGSSDEWQSKGFEIIKEKKYSTGVLLIFRYKES